MTIDEIQEAIIDEMTGVTDWFDKCELIIEQARLMPAMPKDLRTSENKIRGCQSQVWVSAELREGLLYIQADSDSRITRGLIALLLRVVSGHPPEEIANADLHFIRKIGLIANLSPSRANGLALIVQRIHRLANKARGT